MIWQLFICTVKVNKTKKTLETWLYSQGENNTKFSFKNYMMIHKYLQDYKGSRVIFNNLDNF